MKTMKMTETTAFGRYVEKLEREHQRRLNRAMNAELAFRLRTRTEEEAYAALLSLSLFSSKRAGLCGVSGAIALSV